MTDRPDGPDRPDPTEESDPAAPVFAEDLAPISSSNGAPHDPVSGGVHTPLGAEAHMDPDGDGAAEQEPAPDVTADDQIEATRAQIEQTRAEMSETIDAIQEKLSPENLTEQARDTIKEATVGKVEEAVNAAGSKASQTVSSASEVIAGTGSSAAERARRNIIPLASAAAGVAGLLVGRRFMQARKERVQREQELQSRRFSPGVQTLGVFKAVMQTRKGQQKSQSKATGQTLANAQQKARSVAGQVGKRASQIKKAAPQTGRSTSPGDVAGQLRDRVGQVQQNVGRIAERGKAALPQTGRSSRRRKSLGLLFEETPVTVLDLMAALAVAIALAVLRRARRSGWL